MTVRDKLQNIISTAVYKFMYGYFFYKERAVFERKYGSFKDYNELIAETSYVFINANPYLDYPRPVLPKTVMIGGFAASKSEENTKLPQEWDSVLDARDHTVLVSFGSIFKSIDMPNDFKRGLLDTFASMPNVTFIWKYENPNALAASISENVHLSTWVPQAQLLKDSRLSFFLTHGGLASTNEIAYAGKPAIVVPLIGDQTRNANMLARHGGALILHKRDLSDVKRLTDAFMEMLGKSRFVLVY
ncbi:hypothetical protein OESDEN_10404 [Oesophagostomum dentatum]|uniref:glucuronosyltransferase n=1 Tax=Oesophagostomum dentatum TaxID=61180 RepID=A0A0B1SXR9_OESDE|nr:hypothetical protein OESDEN_10404 [Oesophagostomum dentatum]